MSQELLTETVAFVPDVPSSGMRRKQTFCPLDFHLSLSLLPAFFAFFFSFVRHLLGFRSLRKGSAKSPRIVKFFLDEVRVGCGQDFH